MHGPVFGEFLGKLVLILLGDGVVANVLLKKSKGENSGWIVIATVWGFAVTSGITARIAVAGVAHLNPAVTFAAAVASGNWSHVAPFIAAQFAGAFCGCDSPKLCHATKSKISAEAARRGNQTGSRAFPRYANHTGDSDYRVD